MKTPVTTAGRALLCRLVVGQRSHRVDLRRAHGSELSLMESIDVTLAIGRLWVIASLLAAGCLAVQVAVAMLLRAKAWVNGSGSLHCSSPSSCWAPSMRLERLAFCWAGHTLCSGRPGAGVPNSAPVAGHSLRKRRSRVRNMPGILRLAYNCWSWRSRRHTDVSAR